MSDKKSTKKPNGKASTKQVKTVKKLDKKEKKKNKKHPKLRLAIKIAVIVIVVAIIIAAGVFAGLFFGLFGDNLKITAADLSIKKENSVLIDKNGNEIATLNGDDENREVITLAEMGEYLPKAFVAIEDKRFYDHSGVDIKRTIGATIKYATGNSSYGGSTITQQLIKNATGDKDKSWTRKVKEIAKAFQIEREMSKDQILEAYLNTIPLGGGQKNVYGVQVASKYYFNKNPKDLTIAQAAFMAGINHSPNKYLPFKENPDTEKINNRTKTVLYEMKDQNKITEEQYNQAIAEVEAGLAFQEGTITSNNSLTQNEEAAVKQVAEDYAQEHDLDYKVAFQKIKSGGYKIYITEDKQIQNILQEAYADGKWQTKKTVTDKDENGKSYKKTVYLQSGMVVIDHTNGHIVASIGVLGEKTPWGTNRATGSAHQPGSSIKPLAVISPSLQEGLITAGTVVDDTPVRYGTYAPHNSGGGYSGLMNIRSILRVSRNIPEVKMMQKLTPSKSIEYLKSYGFTKMVKEDEGLSLALGGVTNGVTPLEMAGAYATIANDGVYIEPTFYTKVEDSSGKIIMEKKQETHRVISEQNAWLMQSLLTEPTGTGLTGSAGATGTKARVSNMQTCGKTGTTNDTTATWFCGFTPYYSAAMYFGFDEPKYGGSGVPGSGTVAGRWGTIMNKIHKGLDSKSFDKPNDIVTAKICKMSGMLATETCNQDQRGPQVYTEYFAKGTVPKKACTTHVKLKICKVTNKIATEFCKDVEEKVFITRPNSDKETSWQSASDAAFMAPNANCDQHTKPAQKPVITLTGITKDTIEVKQNSPFTMPKATAKDSANTDISKNIKTEIKKDGKVVNKVDTSKLGTYTITYTVADSQNTVETKVITVKVVANGNNTSTNTITNTVR